MKYLIIQNSGDNGVWVSGSKNTLDYIITRYNGNSGIQLSNNSVPNALNYCYSYRNIFIRKKIFDGQIIYSKVKLFSIIALLGIILMLFGIHMIKKEITLPLFHIYIQPAGIMVIHRFSLVNMIMIINGLYDKNMRAVQYLMNSDGNYESNFNNRKFAIFSSAKI